jgi:hypothetical protein
MLRKACAAGLYLGERNGVALRPEDVLPLDGGEFRSLVRDSYGEFAFGLYRVATLGKRHFRVIGAHVNETVDDSAFRKWAEDPGYRPFNLAHAASGISIPAAVGAIAGGSPSAQP